MPPVAVAISTSRSGSVTAAAAGPVLDLDGDETAPRAVSTGVVACTRAGGSAGPDASAQVRSQGWLPQGRAAAGLTDEETGVFGAGGGALGAGGGGGVARPGGAPGARIGRGGGTFGVPGDFVWGAPGGQTQPKPT